MAKRREKARHLLWSMRNFVGTQPNAADPDGLSIRRIDGIFPMSGKNLGVHVACLYLYIFYDMAAGRISCEHRWKSAVAPKRSRRS